MLLNSVQEAVEIAKGKKKIVKFQKAQAKLEKNGTWVKVEDEFKPYYKFVRNE